MSMQTSLQDSILFPLDIFRCPNGLCGNSTFDFFFMICCFPFWLYNLKHLSIVHKLMLLHSLDSACYCLIKKKKRSSLLCAGDRVDESKFYTAVGIPEAR